MARARVALEAAAAVVAMATAPTKATAEAAELAPAMKPAGQAAEADAAKVNAIVEQVPANTQTLQAKTHPAATIPDRAQIRESAALEPHTTRQDRPRSFGIFKREVTSPQGYKARQMRPRVQPMPKAAGTPLRVELIRTRGILLAAAEAAHRYRRTRRASGSTKEAQAKHPETAVRRTEFRLMVLLAALVRRQAQDEPTDQAVTVVRVVAAAVLDEQPRAARARVAGT